MLAVQPCTAEGSRLINRLIDAAKSTGRIFLSVFASGVSPGFKITRVQDHKDDAGAGEGRVRGLTPYPLVTYP